MTVAAGILCCDETQSPGHCAPESAALQSPEAAGCCAVARRRWSEWSDSVAASPVYALHTDGATAEASYAAVTMHQVNAMSNHSVYGGRVATMGLPFAP